MPFSYFPLLEHATFLTEAAGVIPSEGTVALTQHSSLRSEWRAARTANVWVQYQGQIFRLDSSSWVVEYHV
jgi:hypothetical protein